MEPLHFVLALVVLIAAALQTAAGIGFGIIAGPIMLLVLDDNAAIQLSLLLSILIVVMLLPSLRGRLPRIPLLFLLLGSLPGLPLGLWLLLSADLLWLKLLAGGMVLFTLLFASVAGRVGGQQGGKKEFQALLMGVISGVMSGSLAMPGPVPAAWMAARGYGKDVIRATLSSLILMIFPFIFMLQVALGGVRAETLWLALGLALPTLIGVLAGKNLVVYLSERIFGWTLRTVLAATAIALFVTALSSLVFP